MVKKRKTKTDVILKKTIDVGMECPETKTDQNGDQYSQQALEMTSDSQEDKMTERGQKRKSIEPITDSCKFPKIAVADETEIQASSSDLLEVTEGKKDSNSNNTVEQEKISTCILKNDVQITYDKAFGSDTIHVSFEETGVHSEINKILTEIKTTSADNEGVDSFVIGGEESKDKHFQHTSDNDQTKTEAAFSEKTAESIDTLLPEFPSQKTTGINANSVCVPQRNHLHLLDENEENLATHVRMHSLTSEKPDIASSNKKAIPVTIPDDTKLLDSTQDSIEDANTGLEKNATLDINEKMTIMSSQTVSKMMRTDIETKMTCHVELGQEESSTGADTNSKLGGINIALTEAEKENTDKSELEKCPDIPATKDKIDLETSVEDPCKEKDKTGENEDNVESSEDADTKERESQDMETNERENKMEEVEKNEDDIDSVQSQPVSPIDEDIYLQSTAPVNLERNYSEEDEECLAEEAGEGLDTNYDDVLSRSPPATVHHVTREEVAFQSPRLADEAPEMPGNSTGDPAPTTATEMPETHNDDDPILATECQEMAADTGDDLTDSQLFAMDWSSQLPQEPCVPQRSIVKPDLPPPPLRHTGPHPFTRGKPEDGTSIMRGLIREVSQLNKMILKTKREMETMRPKRQYTFHAKRK